jgi:hypothetical protein
LIAKKIIWFLLLSFDFIVDMLKIAGILAAAYLAQVLFAFLMGWL